MACYSFSQLEQLAAGAGFPGPLQPVMAAIAMAESGGCDVIQQGESYTNTGWGLWQITPGNSAPNAGTDFGLLNPQNNAAAAFAKWKSQGLGAWTTYVKGAYLAFMPGSSTYVAGPNNWVGAGNAPPGSSAGTAGPFGDVGGNPFQGVTNIPGQVGGAVGGVASGILKIPGDILGGIGGGIRDALLSVGQHLLPWLIILGVAFFALFMIAKELGASGGGAGGGAGKASGGASAAEMAAA